MTPRTLSRPGQVYVCAVIAAGTCAVTASAYELSRHAPGYQWLILAALTIFTGSATVKLPSIPASLSVSETFVIISVLLFGAPVGTLIVALDGLIISLWLNRGRKQAHRLLFNMCAPAVSVWISARYFFFVAGIRPLIYEPSTVSVSTFIWPLIAFTTLYFVLNSWLIAFAVSFETGQPAMPIWNSNLVWLSLNFCCGATVAALLLTIIPDHGMNLKFLAYVAAILPLLVVFYLTYSTSMARVEDANRHLGEMNQMYLATIETLALAVDAKDQVTHGHIRRVQSFAVALTRRLAGGDRGLLHAMEAASLLHDMGKLAVPEHILNKPGKLSSAEFDRMKLHASIGADILSSIHFPYPVIPIVRHHHENWDGSGYPDGLRGTAIPLGARILSVIDCFDALTSDRPYRPRLTTEQAIGILVNRRGIMYDPLVVDTFMRHVTDSWADNHDDELTESHSAILDLARRIAQNSQPDTVATTGRAAPHTSLKVLQLCWAIASGSRMPSLREAMYSVRASMDAVIPSDLSVLFVYEPHSDDLVVHYAQGLNSHLVSGCKVPLGTHLAGWVGATRRSALNSDPALDFDSRPLPLSGRVHSCLMVPLILGDSLIGTFGLYSVNATRFTPDDQQTAEFLSWHLAAMVSHLTRANSRGLQASVDSRSVSVS